MHIPMTHPTRHRTLRALLAAALVAVAGCTPKDQVAADLLSLNAAGKAATQNTDLQKSMGRVQQAQTNQEKATILRESAAGLAKVQTSLLRIDIRSPEVRDIQARLSSAFGKVGLAANDAASAFEKSDSAALEQAGKAMQESQGEIMALGQDVGRLAQAHKVDLNRQP